MKSKLGNRKLEMAGRALYVCFALLALPASVHAFDVAYDIQPRTLAVGDAATCTITIRGLQNPPVPAFPQIDGITVSGPSQQSHVSIVNGSMDRSISFLYRLVPIQPGNYTIGPFIYQAQGQNAQLPAVTLQVAAQPGGAGATAANIQQHLFAKISTERTEVYNQETLDIIIAVYYSGLRLARDLELLNMPESGLSRETLQDMGAERKMINNQVFDVRKFRLSMRAISAGTYKLEPSIRVGVVVEKKRQQSGKVFDDPVFDRFFGNGFFKRNEIHPVTIPTEPVDIVVKTIPTDSQPEDFSGAVGTFEFDASITPTEVNVGDPVTLNMRVAGYGNIESVTTPKVMLSERFKSYEARLTAKEISEDRRAGMKTFEQVFIPRTDAVTEFPATSFTFFDPKEGLYRQVKRGPFPLKVSPSSNDLMRIVEASSGGVQSVAPILGTDIVYLKPEPRTWTDGDVTPLYRRPLFVGIHLTPSLALFAVLMSVRRREVLDKDVARARRQRAPKAARASIRKAQDAMNQGEADAFYEAVWEALASYIGHRFNLRPGDVTREKTASLLKRCEAEAAVITSANQLFEACELQRFSSSSASASPDTMQNLLAQLNTLLRTCERLRKR